MARAGEVSTVCQNPTQFSYNVSFCSQWQHSECGMTLQKEERVRSLVLCGTFLSSVPVLQSWEPLVLGARCRGKPVQKITIVLFADMC